MKPNIRIEQYQVAADTVSIGGVQWLTKYDVKVQFSDRDTAYAWKARIEQMLNREVQRQPLTDEQIRSMCKETWVFETVKKWARLIEAAHGIKEKT